MKIQVERDVLAEAVAWTARALQARPAVPVLAGIRLQAATDLTLSSFDYDVSAQARVPVEAEEEGEALVSGGCSRRSPGACPPARWRSPPMARGPR